VKRMLLVCLVIVAAVSLAISGCTSETAPQTPGSSTPSTPTPSTPEPAKTVTLKATFYQPSNHLSVVNFKKIFADIEVLTEGRVKVDVYDAQTLVKVPETLDALNRGIADITSCPLVPLRLDVPWWGAEMLPGVLKDRKGMYDAAENGLLDMYQEAIYSRGLGVRIVHLFCGGENYLMTKGKRVAVPEDMKGLKIATQDAFQASVLDTLGATSVVMNTPEIYEALLRGMVDGGPSNLNGLAQYNWTEPCEYLLMYPFGGPYVAVMISELNLAKLSAADQGILLHLAREQGITEELDLAIAQGRVLEEDIKPELKEVVYLTSEQRQKWDDAVAPLIDEWLAKAGEDGQKALDIMRQYNP
jgi:TRAP-type C4-dicarboxylate transport system substrate-binding protein